MPNSEQDYNPTNESRELSHKAQSPFSKNVQGDPSLPEQGNAASRVTHTVDDHLLTEIVSQRIKSAITTYFFKAVSISDASCSVTPSGSVGSYARKTFINNTLVDQDFILGYVGEKTDKDLDEEITSEVVNRIAVFLNEATTIVIIDNIEKKSDKDIIEEIVSHAADRTVVLLGEATPVIIDSNKYLKARITLSGLTPDEVTEGSKVSDYSISVNLDESVNTFETLSELDEIDVLIRESHAVTRQIRESTRQSLEDLCRVVSEL